MAKTDITKIRNIALVGHGDAGKTAFAEDLLFRAGVLGRRGRVEDGNTACDFDDEEIKRKFSVSAALVNADYQGVHINLLDIPGSADFIVELISCLRVVDGALVVVSAVGGVEVGTDRAWRECDRNNCARAVVITKMDRERADFERTLGQLRESFPGVNFVVMTYPVGAEMAFKGYVDVRGAKAVLWNAGLEKEGADAEVPADLKAKLDELNGKVVEAAAEQDDALMEKFFEAGTLSPEEVARGLAAGFRARKVVPVFCADAVHGVGSSAVLDAIAAYFPSPADAPARVGVKPGPEDRAERQAAADGPLSAYVFKTVNDAFAGKLSLVRIYSGTVKVDDQLVDVNADAKFRVTALLSVNGKKQTPVPELVAGEIGALAKIEALQTGHTFAASSALIQYPDLVIPEAVMHYAISPRSKGDEDKLTASLTKLREEDPSFHVERNAETKEFVASGMGEQHLLVMFSKLEARFGVGVDARTPRVAYRETIRKKARAQGRFKKQTGGRGQFGDVWLELEPRERGAGYEFVNSIFGGSIPTKFVPSVEKGVVEIMNKGVIAGYPVVDVRVSVYDGSFHPVDSSDMAFKIAGTIGFKNAFAEAGPTLLEPIVEVTVLVPAEFMGAVTGDLSGKRGRLMGMDSAGRFQEIKALVPQSETFRFASDLRSITGGQGSFTVKFSHYEEAPADVQKKIVEAAAKEKGEEEE
jgi:elongation factor G